MLRTAFSILVTVIDTIIFSILAILASIGNPYNPVTDWILTTWARIIIFSSGNKLIVEGRERLDPAAVYVFAANHQSNFDIPALVLATKRTVRFVAKKELFRIPLFAQGMKMSGMIAIDRGNSQMARQSMQEAAQKMRRGVSVIIFPEGTRSRDGEIAPFKKGAFILALEGGFPVVPVSVSGSFFIMQKNSWRMRRGNIKIVFGEPVQPENYSAGQRQEILDETRRRIEANFDPDFNRES